jgi:hypothetical protein
MARASLTAQETGSSGQAVTMTNTASADGISFANTGREMVLLENDTEGAVTVTVQTPAEIDGDLAIAERTLSVASGAIATIGPFSKQYYNQSDGAVYVDFDEDGVGAAVIRWPH